MWNLFVVVPHSPDDSGNLTAGEGVIGLIGAGAVGKIALDNTGGIQSLHVDVVGVGEGLLVGEIGDGELHGLSGDLGDLEPGDGAVELGIALYQTIGLGAGQIAAEGAALCGGRLLRVAGGQHNELQRRAVGDGVLLLEGAVGIAGDDIGVGKLCDVLILIFIYY